MPTKAYDRVKNANQASDMFVRTPYWTPETEVQFQDWLKQPLESQPPELIDEYLLNGVAVSFKMMEGSVCCTLSHQDRRAKDLPHLLTGWSDNWSDALLVAHYKISLMLDGSWDGIGLAVKAPRR